MARVNGWTAWRRGWWRERAACELAAELLFGRVEGGLGCDLCVAGAGDCASHATSIDYLRGRGLPV